MSLVHITKNMAKNLQWWKKKVSCMWIICNSTSSQTLCTLSILFHRTMWKKREYAQFISRECQIRSIPLHGTLEDWRLSLYQSISLMEWYRQWNDEGQKTVALMKAIELLIPCILHCKNHVGEKILTILLWRQLDHFPGPKMDFIQRMDTTFKTQIQHMKQAERNWLNGKCYKKMFCPVMCYSVTAKNILDKIRVVWSRHVEKSWFNFKNL
jgi:hypothetical protein